MMKIFTAAILVLLLTLAGCSAVDESSIDESSGSKESVTTGMYTKITAEEAKTLIDSGTDVVILDVRTQEEYDAGHIEGAVLLPYDRIDQEAEAMFTDKDIMILIYCRSGNRSAIAARSFIALGYSDVTDFGGIIDWPYDIVKE